MQALLSASSSSTLPMPEASVAEPEKERADSAGSLGCWWKTTLSQTCRSLVALKNTAPDGSVAEQIYRAIVRLNFLMRYASNAACARHFADVGRP